MFIDSVLTSPISVPFDALIRFFSVLGYILLEVEQRQAFEGKLFIWEILPGIIRRGYKIKHRSK